MSNIELFVNGTHDTIGKINLHGDEPISLNISVTDVTDISKRNSTFSQTFTIPADKNNNILLNHIFNIGSDSTFDPSKKTSCYMLNETVLIFSGTFQLTKISVKDKNVLGYECVVYGEVIDLVKSLGDKLLTDLDFSELDHHFSVADIENSWTADTKSLGYYYPLIDYGFDLGMSELNNGVLSIVIESGIVSSSTTTILTDSTKLWATNAFAGKTLYITTGAGLGQTRSIVSNTLTTITISTAFTTPLDTSSHYNVTQLDYTNPYGSTGNGMSPLLFRPALSNTYLINKIINNAGYVIDCDLLNNDIIGETILPYNADSSDVLPKAYMNEYAFRASKTLNETCGSSSGYTNIIVFPNDSTGPNFDNSNLWNQPGFANKYVADRTSTQSFVVNIRWYLTGYNVTAPKRVTVDFYRSSYTVGPYTSITYDTPGVPAMGVDYNNTFQSDVLDNPQSTIGLYPVQLGEEFTVHYTWQFGGGNHSTIVRHTNTYMYNVITPKLVPNIKLFYNKFIPANIKQVDYIKSIITMFNLIIIPDKNNKNKLKFIPRTTYYKNGNVKNWTNKVDHSSNIDESILSEQQNRSIIFSYKPDKDYYNTFYTDKTKYVYGQYTKYIDNEWIDGQKKIDIIFSPTPVDKVLGSTDIYLPKLFKRDEKSGVYSRTDFNIRFLVKRKQPLITTGTIQLEGRPPRNSYPYCGHLDHPVNPTIDYNFGSIQWAFYPELTGLTPNNLVENNWQEYLDDISDKNSKLIKCKIYLTPNDIAQFDYNDSIFIDGLTDDGGHYFNVNKINYIPTSNLSSAVELIKVDRAPTVKGGIKIIDNTAVSLDPINFVGIGSNNTSGTGQTMAIGKNNKIGFNSPNGIILGGSNNTIANNTPGVTIINSSNRTVNTPFVTIVGNTYFNPDGTSYVMYNDIECGKDVVLAPFGTNAFNDKDSGKDEVLGIGSSSPIQDINSGEDTTI